MTVRTKLYGQIGVNYKSGSDRRFSTPPPLTPPEPVSLVTSEEAWGLKGGPVLVPGTLPLSAVPVSERAKSAALNAILKSLPNTQKIHRWDRETATTHLVDFQYGHGKPDIPDDWRSDEGWARAFVQGPCSGDLQKEGDVYVVDATSLAQFDVYPGYAPIGVKVAIRIDEEGTRPAWVEIVETGNGARKRVLPSDPEWPAARIIASAGMHNHVVNERHVCHMHLTTAQTISVLCHNHLPWHHPIQRLLFPHNAGTVLVNFTVRESFMKPHTFGDQVYPLTWKGLNQLYVHHLKAFEWDWYNIPEILVKRGTMDLVERKLFPYGEDALLIWGAIDKYVGDYLSQYYKDDADVLADTVLQEALTALDPATPKPLRARSLAELRLVLTRLIHIVIVEHHLVAIIVYDYFANPYFFPAKARPGRTIEEVVPYREEAEQNTMFRYSISSTAWRLLQDWSYVALDEKGAGAMRRFQENLNGVGAEIDARNARRKHPFTAFHPSNLDTSVAV